VLHVATVNDHVAVAQLLLSRSADVNNSRDLEGLTPLRWANDLHQKDVVELLRSYGAKK
jgi:ankyrin repeat protein